MISIISNKRLGPFYTSVHDIYTGAITMLAKFYDTPWQDNIMIMKQFIEEMLLKYLETIQPICEIGVLAPYRE